MTGPGLLVKRPTLSISLYACASVFPSDPHNNLGRYLRHIGALMRSGRGEREGGSTARVAGQKSRMRAVCFSHMHAKVHVLVVCRLSTILHRWPDNTSASIMKQLSRLITLPSDKINGSRFTLSPAF